MAACLFIEGFFSGSEIAMFSANRLALQSQAGDGGRLAQVALDLIEREDRLISTCLIGTNLAVITGTTLAMLFVVSAGVNETWVLAYIPLTVIFGEALPKTVFQFHATVMAPRLAPVLRIAQLVFTPLLAIAGLWSSLLRRLSSSEASTFSRQDLVDLLEDEDAAILPEEQAMIRRVFRLGEVDVSDAMTPLVDVDAVPETATVDDAITVALAGGHSRIVVYRDRIDNVAGVVDMFDLLYDPDVEGMVADRMGPVRFVPETQRADALLQDMRQSRDHFAVVVDEYGGSVGIVTIEDLLEEIIGEIQDERDEDEPRVRRLGDRQWRVPARTELDELEEAVSMDIPDGDYETVGGLVLAHMGRIPSKGESIDVEGMRYKAEEVSDRAILIVLATRL
ncbi:MAG: CBS domain containing-hemolysin-like protein [bacterium]|jgi:CBS domain containing-hemolysin-like protein